MPRTSLVTLSTILMVFVSLVVRAQPPPQSQRDEPPWSADPLEAFVDGLMAGQRKAHHIAGAVVVVVSDGEILLEKGYGYADLAEGRPVDADRTLFRLASNSKMFVWTAVMQLVEKGRLDLHTDINRYLNGLQIPPTFAEPITIANLMSHTPGFADAQMGFFSADAPVSKSLLEHARERMPHRIFPPGEVRAYSNYGALLAALIVEQESGVPYARYLDEEILGPLGMTRTTLAEPVPVDLGRDVSKGYRWIDGRFVEQPFVYTSWAGPAGAMSATGHDIGRFMIAQLQDGVLDNARILGPEAASRLREDLIPFSPAINNFLHGFVQMDMNGEKVFGHPGDYVYFHSMTAMLPERSKGLFVAVNTDTGRIAVQEIYEAFIDRYYPPGEPAEPAFAANVASGLRRFAGEYAPTRRSDGDMLKMVMLAGAVRFDVEDDHLVSRSVEGTRRWRQIAPLAFTEVDGIGRLAFREDDRGGVRYAAASPMPGYALEKQRWWNAESVNTFILIALVSTLVAGLIGFPIAAALHDGDIGPPLSRIARLTSWLASFGFLVGWLSVLPVMRYPEELSFGAPPPVRLAYGFWLAAAMLTIGPLFFAVAAWRRRWWRLPGRVSYTVVGAALVGMVLWLAHWNLLGFRP